MSKRRKFSAEFKHGAVEQIKQPGVSCAQVARLLDPMRETLPVQPTHRASRRPLDKTFHLLLWQAASAEFGDEGEGGSLTSLAIEGGVFSRQPRDRRWRRCCLLISSCRRLSCLGWMTLCGPNDPSACLPYSPRPRWRGHCQCLSARLLGVTLLPRIGWRLVRTFAPRERSCGIPT